jgi:hypothetical protein
MPDAQGNAVTLAVLTVVPARLKANLGDMLSTKPTTVNETATNVWKDRSKECTGNICAAAHAILPNNNMTTGGGIFVSSVRM